MVGPFKALNGDGTLIKSFDNPYYAIAAASEAGLSTNKTYVTDSNGLKIFARTRKTTIYCFDGPSFLGTKDYDEAIEWASGKSRSWLVNGLGNGYSYLGRDEMKGTQEVSAVQLELASGAYNYLFSNQGTLDQEAGYAYGKCIVRLSEAKYKPSADGNGWNAYVFINVAGGGASNDMGLIGNLDKTDGTVHWRPCKNCTYAAGHNGDSFMTYPSDVMTTSTLDSSTGEYVGADDISIEAWADPDGFEFNLKNLKTGKTFHHREDHAGVNKNEAYYRVLLASSYCPVVAPIWNGSCGAELSNVVFDNVKIAKYKAGNAYAEADEEDFYPGESNVAYGYSQGAYWATHESGTRKENGTYASGATYAKDDKYVTFSVNYDGKAHEGE